MAQRLGNLSKWQYLPEGDALVFDLDKVRTVAVDINAPSEVSVYVLQDLERVTEDPARQAEIEQGRQVPERELTEPQDGRDSELLQFVGLVRGRDRLEFGVDGPFKLLVEGGGAYVYSHDGQEIHSQVVAPVIFTRIANRKERNHHLEMMQYTMRINQKRLEQRMFDEVERRMQALEQRTERHVRGRGEAAVIVDAPEQTEGGARQQVDAPPLDGGEVERGAEDAGKGKRSKASAGKQADPWTAPDD